MPTISRGVGQGTFPYNYASAEFKTKEDREIKTYDQCSPHPVGSGGSEDHHEDTMARAPS